MGFKVVVNGDGEEMRLACKQRADSQCLEGKGPSIDLVD